MLSSEVQEVLRDALMEVHKRRHDLLTVEHVLFAMTRNARGRIILEGSGASVKVLREQLEGFFRAELEAVMPPARLEVGQTASLQRVMERAVEQIRTAGRDMVEMGDLLVAILDEDESYAMFYLQKQGVNRLDVLTFVSHGLPDGRGSKGVSGGSESEGEGGKGDPLAQFTVDLVARATEGKIDPLVGRDKELDRTLEILCRRRKNNPLFIGDPGVGKTALAEGLALRLSKGDVPKPFEGMRIYALDMGQVLAGTRYRGDFEQRIKGIIQALKSQKNAILFIDEIHTIVGAGSSTGNSMDASNLLKPVLAAGEVRCIGSTTYEEFRNNFEKDRALARRFQRIDLQEPSSEECLQILHGLQEKYAKHHGVRYSARVLQTIVELSARHVRDRLLPDKAIDVLDEVGARVRLKAPEAPEAGLSVTAADVEHVVARMAGVPLRTVSGKEREQLATLESELKRVVFGQDEAIEAVVRAILRSRAGLSQEHRPSGSFLFYGPTGVGKTEVARSLALQLGVDFLRYDMSEYMEKHAVSRLIGAPPGYVGFDQGGLLTEAVRKSPYCVVLLDEVEKAHPDIFNVLLQVMDYATLTDNTGRKADFSNAILIMTSNAGAFEMSQASIGFGEVGANEAAHKSLKAVERTFSPEFRNRLDALVPFNSLTEPMMLRIVDKFVAQLQDSLKGRSIALSVDDAARQWLARKGFDRAMGARPLARLLRSEVEDRLAQEMLFGDLKRGGEALLSVDGEALAVTSKPLRPSRRASGKAATSAGKATASAEKAAPVPV